MRTPMRRVLQYGAVVVLLSLLAVPLFAADSILLGGLNRHGIAGQVIRVPVVVKDVAATPAGADQASPDDQIRYISVKATFSTDSLVAACGTSPNCSFIEAGIAPTLNVLADINDPCGALDGTPNIPCYFKSVTVQSVPNTISYIVAFSAPLVTHTTAQRGDLIGYMKLKLSPTFPGGGTVTITPTTAEAYLSGYDVYSNDGNPSSDETVANTNLTVSTYQPADADNSGTIAQADLTKVITDLQSVPGSNVTGTNFRDDCDADGKITGADVLCVFTELNPNVNAGFQKQLLDIDNDGNVDAATDGIILLRLAFGFVGTDVTTNALAPGAKRTNPTEIEAYYTALNAAMDIDKNASTDAATDMIMILRYMFGFVGTDISTSAIGSGATRNAAGIESYLNALNVQ